VLLLSQHHSRLRVKEFQNCSKISSWIESILTPPKEVNQRQLFFFEGVKESEQGGGRGRQRVAKLLLAEFGRSVAAQNRDLPSGSCRDGLDEFAVVAAGDVDSRGREAESGEEGGKEEDDEGL
jgi:hypothetical protein